MEHSDVENPPRRQVMVREVGVELGVLRPRKRWGEREHVVIAFDVRVDGVRGILTLATSGGSGLRRPRVRVGRGC